MLKNFNSLVQGNSQTFNFKFIDTSTGDPVDITGWTIFVTIKRNQEMSDEEATGVNGLQKDVTPTDPTTGQCSLELVYADTKDLTGTYYYDVTYQTGESERQTIMIGTMTFQKCITKRIE